MSTLPFWESRRQHENRVRSIVDSMEFASDSVYVDFEDDGFSIDGHLRLEEIQRLLDVVKETSPAENHTEFSSL